VTVPITWSVSEPRDDASRRQRMYYSGLHRILAAENDYYHIAEGGAGLYWIKAAHMRIVSPTEMGPLSPQVAAEDKRIEIRIGEQMLRAYEGEREVFSAQVSTGVPDSPTPSGEFRVRDKRPGQRMVGGQGSGGYNLAGIPWICYFNSTWVATHGCYWHNDYGRRHSNGCVNLTPQAASWIFRWTTPAVNYAAFRTLPNVDAGQPGTRVVVRW
jgi:lipoprotein-anchoring transpeptidase ErfK/SrfK